MDIGNLLDPKIKLTDPLKDRSDTWSKTFCFKIVHAGVSKLISNSVTIEMYDTVIESVRKCMMVFKNLPRSYMELM